MLAVIAAMSTLSKAVFGDSVRLADYGNTTKYAFGTLTRDMNKVRARASKATKTYVLCLDYWLHSVEHFRENYVRLQQATHTHVSAKHMGISSLLDTLLSGRTSAD